eukprot:6174569-Pleurochrysis_carterae.AAC.1
MKLQPLASTTALLCQSRFDLDIRLSTGPGAVSVLNTFQSKHGRGNEQECAFAATGIRHDGMESWVYCAPAGKLAIRTRCVQVSDAGGHAW